MNYKINCFFWFWIPKWIWKEQMIHGLNSHSCLVFEVYIHGSRAGNLFFFSCFSARSCWFSKWANSFQKLGLLLCKQQDLPAPTLTVFVCHTSCYDNSMWPHLLLRLTVPLSWVCQWLSDVCPCVCVRACVCSVMKYFPLHLLKSESERKEGTLLLCDSE